MFPSLQATLAATAMAATDNSNQQHPEAAAAASSFPGPAPAMEAVVSLAMYLTELALLDAACCAFPGSSVATAALLLAHATLAGHCGAWPLVLAAAGSSEQQVGPALAALQALHAASAGATGQVGELLLPLKAKFAQDCWCRVAAEVTPLQLQQQAVGAAAQGFPAQQQQQAVGAAAQGFPAQQQQQAVGAAAQGFPALQLQQQQQAVGAAAQGFPAQQQQQQMR
jgi:hypothetical protein